MTFPVFKSRPDAEQHLLSLNYLPQADGSFCFLQRVVTIEETVGGFTLNTKYPALQELHERGQCLIEEGIHRRRFSVLGGEGK